MNRTISIDVKDYGGDRIAVTITRDRECLAVDTSRKDLESFSDYLAGFLKSPQGSNGFTAHLPEAGSAGHRNY